MSASNTNDRVVGAHLAMLREQVTGLVTGEEWCRFLAVQARFHRYSFWNSMAIVAQHPRRDPGRGLPAVGVVGSPGQAW